MAARGLNVLTAASLLYACVGPVATQHCGIPGLPGIPGTHGQHGKDGLKGEEGDPGEPGLPIRGQKGTPGLMGLSGRPGLKGDRGAQGPPGEPGQPGEKGQPLNPSNQQTSFFCYKWTLYQTAELNSPLVFSGEILPNLDQRFKGKTLTNGVFTCDIKGIYFFSYHISANRRVCLRLMKGEETHMSMCDTSEGFLITSGSAVLELELGDTVSLVPVQHNTIVTTQSSATNIFNGFLIFPTL
ncbi:complement C1q subcomponent subunit B-like [Takifugu rubripes]|nr:complement C1q subcomponent subunit B-like [Takifugu rubripes]|eukprot:XP_003976542.1 PREDICTED: complement C1q subcomponent subunit B-like [Takifugu rubripes]